MSRQPLVICGLTPFAGMVAHCFHEESDFEVVAFTAHERFMSSTDFRGRPVVPLEQMVAYFPPGEVAVFAAVEYKWLNAARRQVWSELQSMGYKAASFIHPNSEVCSDVELDEHCFVMESVVVSFGSRIGANNILFPRTFVGMGACLGSHNYLSPGVVLDRDTIVGDHCFLGTGTMVTGDGSLGDWCYTRPRQTIVEPVAPGTTFNPSLRAPGRVVDRRADSKASV